MFDQNFTIKKAGPTGSAATEYSDPLDFGGASSGLPSGLGKGNLTGKIRLLLRLPAITGLDDTKTITYTIQDSADNSSYSDLTAVYPAKVQTGAGGAGAGAADYYFDYTPGLRRYVRVKAVTASSPGTITAYTYYLIAIVGNQPGL